MFKKKLSQILCSISVSLMIAGCAEQVSTMQKASETGASNEAEKKYTKVASVSENDAEVSTPSVSSDSVVALLKLLSFYKGNILRCNTSGACSKVGLGYESDALEITIDGVTESLRRSPQNLNAISHFDNTKFDQKNGTFKMHTWSIVYFETASGRSNDTFLTRKGRDECKTGEQSSSLLALEGVSGSAETSTSEYWINFGNNDYSKCIAFRKSLQELLSGF